MTSSERQTINDKLEADYESSSFEVVEASEVPDLNELPKGKAAKLDDVAFGFFDLRGFTRWSNGKRDRSVFKVLQPALAALTRAIRLHDGVIEKPTGDGLMFIIGADENDKEKAAVRALQCALDLVDVMDNVINPFMKRQRHIEEPFQWGIGLAMGSALIAKVGIRNHFFMTSISKAANYASKLEDAAEAGTVLVNERIYNLAPEAVKDRLSHLGEVHDQPAYSLDVMLDSDNRPTTVAKAMSSAQIERFGLRAWVLGGVSPSAALNGAKASKPHRWYGDPH